MGEFQFLIGSLGTVLQNAASIIISQFQFLIGSLGTVKVKVCICAHLRVSIPYR